VNDITVGSLELVEFRVDVVVDEWADLGWGNAWYEGIGWGWEC